MRGSKGVEALGAERATDAILQSPSVLTASADNIKSSSEALAEHLGKAGMLLAVDNSSILLRSGGDKIHQTAAVVKGLLGDSDGTDLLKEKPRLFQASATLIEGNFQTLCDAFERELVMKAVLPRPSLLYDRSTTKRVVKSGILNYE